MTDFQQQFMGQFPAQSRGYKEVLRWWLTYFVGTENFDRTLPGGWMSGDCWMPHGCAIMQSRRHAQTLRLETVKTVNIWVQGRQVTAEEAKSAEKEAANMHHMERVALLQALDKELA